MSEYSFDLHRIFFGDLPLLFLVEIVFRTIVLYAYTVFLIRITPRRNISQMTPLEILIIITLGSATGDPMFYPQVPVIHGLLVITLVILIQTVMAKLTGISSAIENIIEGNPIRLARNGILDLDGMKKASMTQEDVFVQVRLNGYENMGQVRSAYIEPNGQISIDSYPPDQVRSGLQIAPPFDEKHAHMTKYKMSNKVPVTQDYVCLRCGKVTHYQSSELFENCSNCNAEKWTDADKVNATTSRDYR